MTPDAVGGTFKATVGSGLQVGMPPMCLLGRPIVGRSGAGAQRSRPLQTGRGLWVGSEDGIYLCAGGGGALPPERRVAAFPPGVASGRTLELKKGTRAGASGVVVKSLMSHLGTDAPKAP